MAKEVDLNSNGAIDIAFGGTDATTLAQAKINLEIPVPLWDRNDGTNTLHPKTDNDNLDLGTGDLSAGNGNFTGELQINNAPDTGVEIKRNASNTGLMTAHNLSPADPSSSAISDGANFGFNGAPNNFYGMGLGAVRNSAYDIWFGTGIVNGGGFRFYKGTTELFTVSKDGNLGVGIITPIEKVDIDGKAGSAFVKLCNDTTGRLDNEGLYLGVAGTSGDGYVGTRHNKPLHLRTNQIDAIFIDENQNTGFKTITPDGIIDATPDTITATSYSYGTRVTTAQMNALTGMTSGASVYNLTTESNFTYNTTLSAWIEQ